LTPHPALSPRAGERGKPYTPTFLKTLKHPRNSAPPLYLTPLQIRKPHNTHGIQLSP